MTEGRIVSKIGSLNELMAVQEWAIDETGTTTIVVRNRWLTVSLIDSDEHGDMIFQRIPTDDEEDVPSGYVDNVPGVDTGWPLELLWPYGTRENGWGVYERIEAPFVPDHTRRNQNA